MWHMAVIKIYLKFEMGGYGLILTRALTPERPGPGCSKLMTLLVNVSLNF